MSILTDTYRDGAADLLRSGLMPLIVSDDDSIVWIVPTEAGVPNDLDLYAVTCVRGGTVDIAECSHLICDCGGIGGGCDLPDGDDRVTYPGSYYEPTEYETICRNCSDDYWQNVAEARAEALAEAYYD